MRRLAWIALATLAASTTLAASSSSALSATSRTSSPRQATTGVVLVNTTLAIGGAAAGTGVVLTSSGEVLTNNHVIRGAKTIRVTVPALGRTYRATVAGYSVSKDVALLRLSGAGGLQVVSTGSSSTVAVGDRVVAVGNSGGAGLLRTKNGKVARLNRTITVTDDGLVVRLTRLIQTNAPLEPGDSGGPLLRQGRVVGIDAAASHDFSFENVGSEGYAIPIDSALAIARRIESGKPSSTVHIGPTAFLGVSLADPRGSAPEVPGALVQPAAAGSPAAKAGVGPRSVITAFAGRRVTSGNQLRTLVLRRDPGDTVKLVWVDELGARKSAIVRLASGPPQ
jgi:S1-C subfamily serine protease